MSVIMIAAIVSLVVGTGAGYGIRKVVARKRTDEAEAKAGKLLEEAKTKQKELVLEGRGKAIKIAEEAKVEEQERRQQVLHAEKRIDKREEALDQRENSLERKNKGLNNKEREISKIKKELIAIKQQQLEKLEKVAALSTEQAKKHLLSVVERDLRTEITDQIKKYKGVAEEESKRNAQKIIAFAIERYSRDQSAEMTASSVNLPSDEMKGRIIGKEGRNIKRFEELTGVEIIVDDTPEAIVISGFNPIRRHVAKRALEKLIQDGRIHPARIEETILKVKQEIAQDIKEAGEEAVYELGITGLNPKLVQLVGRLKFRSSFGQNVLKHSIEVANIANMLCEELGARTNIVKQAGLLHDIGKAVDHEVEGTHIEIGRKILEKFGVAEEVIHAMECHHGDVEPTTVEAVIVTAADGISGSRVGARKDSYEDYIKRLEELENIASTFPGVDKVYAVQAGREVRVFVRPEELDDEGSLLLARNVANRIEEELKYPGEIKVNVIRELRAIEYAR
ncbi:ribonuclease Y [Patescibacteria group bacterium]|nr:ribonuclease Y [Patescibacteria group bacterium]